MNGDVRGIPHYIPFEKLYVRLGCDFQCICDCSKVGEMDDVNMLATTHYLSLFPISLQRVRQLMSTE